MKGLGGDPRPTVGEARGLAAAVGDTKGRRCREGLQQRNSASFLWEHAEKYVRVYVELQKNGVYVCRCDL